MSKKAKQLKIARKTRNKAYTSLGSNNFAFISAASQLREQIKKALWEIKHIKLQKSGD